MTTNRIPTLAEVIDNAITTRLSDTYHALPGIVVTYYPTTQDADIQIAVNDPRFDPDTDEVSTEQWPIYPHVRVAWPRFGGMTIIGPMNPGDKVQVFFQDLDDSNFRTTGAAGDPNRTLRHGSDAAFCLPWDITDAGVAHDAAAAATALVLGKDGAQQQIRINGTTIQLGATGGDFVALASKVDACMAAIKTHVHDCSTVNDGSGHSCVGNTAPSTALSSLPATGSTLVAAQ